MHALSWNKVTAPRSLGGLGIKNLSTFSDSLLAPAILPVLNQECSILWVDLLLNK